MDYDSQPKFKRRKTESHLTKALDVLQGVLENGKSPLGQQFARWRLWRKWSDVVGPEIAKNTEPMGFNPKSEVLLVWVSNSVWMQQMVFLAGPIRDKVNHYVGKEWVKQVRFTLDKHSIP